MMLEAVEQRFGSYRTPHPVEMLSDNGSPYIASETRALDVSHMRPASGPLGGGKSRLRDRLEPLRSAR